MNTLVIVGHPLTGSFTRALADSYAEAARAGGADVRILDLATTSFPHDPESRDELRARDSRDHLPAVIRDLIADVEWADHLVVVYPQWWGTYPAVLKAFIDRVFLSGVSFRYGKGPISERLWAGKTARIVMVMDSPRFWNRLVYRNASETALSRATFGYCGVKTVGITRFTPVRFSTLEKRQGWLRQVAALGRTDAARGRSRTSPAALVDA